MIDESRTIIPALGGWSVALFVPAGSTWSERLELMPIVAWEIVRKEEHYDRAPRERRAWYEAIPITPAGDMNSIGGEWAIRLPEGGFYLPDEPWSGTEADAKTLLRERDEQVHIEHAARKQAKTA